MQIVYATTSTAGLHCFCKGLAEMIHLLPAVAACVPACATRVARCTVPAGLQDAVRVSGKEGAGGGQAGHSLAQGCGVQQQRGCDRATVTPNTSSFGV